VRYSFEQSIVGLRRLIFESFEQDEQVVGYARRKPLVRVQEPLKSGNVVCPAHQMGDADFACLSH
jgi:hypothetical protein